MCFALQLDTLPLAFGMLEVRCGCGRCSYFPFWCLEQNLLGPAEAQEAHFSQSILQIDGKPCQQRQCRYETIVFNKLTCLLGVLAKTSFKQAVSCKMMSSWCSENHFPTKLRTTCFPFVPTKAYPFFKDLLRLKRAPFTPKEEGKLTFCQHHFDLVETKLPFLRNTPRLPLLQRPTNNQVGRQVEPVLPSLVTTSILQSDSKLFLFFELPKNMKINIE